MVAVLGFRTPVLARATVEFTMRYLISYDILVPKPDYDVVHGHLTSALKGMGGRQLLLSQWSVRRPGESAVMIGDALFRRTGSDSRVRILVTEFPDPWWSTGGLLDQPGEA